MQAAIGVSQLNKLDGFIGARKRNFSQLKEGLGDLQDIFILPDATPGSDPSWFGFPLSVRPESGLSRDRVIQHLDSRRIGTRLLFGGNLVRQPAYSKSQMRIVGDLKNADFVMNHAFWIGVYPGVTSDMVDYMLGSLRGIAEFKCAAL